MQSVTELFMDLVQIDSVSGEEEEMIQEIVRFSKQNCDLEANVDSHGNVTIQTDGTGEALFLCAHLDTVEPGRGIIPELKDGIIRSTGNTILGADDKGAVAAILAALQHITTNSKIKWRPLDIVFTVSEEEECKGAKGYDTSALRAKTGIIFDGTGPIETIMSASPYYARFDIEIQGKSAHAGYPEKATAALPTFLSLATEIKKLRSNDLLINIGKISGGNARNTVMGKIIMHGEVRSFDLATFQNGLSTLQALLDTPYACEIISEIVIENPGYSHTEDEIDSMTKIIDSALNTTTTHKKSFGVSDANIFNQSQNLNVYNLGDGSKHAHTTREETSVYALERMQELILKLADSSTKISQEER
ncbi:MAG: M20/M25/M40 family metallo-hydrolase [Candidatus Pacebacteria bacterium]|nr:M20/M25/M40 family metallo-hydrolase [Candidatus Paceibacterota bacterium]